VSQGVLAGRSTFHSPGAGILRCICADDECPTPRGPVQPGFGLRGEVGLPDPGILPIHSVICAPGS